MAGRGDSTRTRAGWGTTCLARAALLVSASLVTLPLGSQPAAASSCGGVAVVVDPPRADTSVSCVDPDSDSAADLFEKAGRELTRVQRFPGAVCRVDGVPAGQPCVAMPPADAYWGFFVSDGDTWEYSSLGVDAVTPEPGQSIALVWQDTAEHQEPDVAPSAAGRGPQAPAEGASTAESEPVVSVQTLVAASLVVVLGGAAVVVARRRR